MGIDDFTGWRFNNDTDEELVAVMDKHLPKGWKKNADHRRQVYRVVENFLKTPDKMGTKDREKRARYLTLDQEENVDTQRTIADATGRRLYVQTPYRSKFRRDVEQIEKEYRSR